MLRYHKNVYFKEADIKRLKLFTDDLNRLNWQYTAHSIDNLKYRAIDIEALLFFVKGLQLNRDDVFEFYIDDISKDIIKACYRVSWQGNSDIILVIGESKQIITIYLNSTEDNHTTLKKELYQRC